MRKGSGHLDKGGHTKHSLLSLLELYKYHIVLAHISIIHSSYFQFSKQHIESSTIP